MIIIDKKHTLLLLEHILYQNLLNNVNFMIKLILCVKINFTSTRLQHS